VPFYSNQQRRILIKTARKRLLCRSKETFLLLKVDISPIKEKSSQNIDGKIRSNTIYPSFFGVTYLKPIIGMIL